MRKWLADQLDLLDRAKGKRESRSGLARAIGQPPSRVQEMINSTRNIQAHEILPMARYLGMPFAEVYELATGLSIMDAGPDIPLIAKVTPGGEYVSTDPSEIRTVGGPPEMPTLTDDDGRLVAAVVEGNAYTPAYRDGDTIYFLDRRHADWRPHVGRDCFVKLAGQESITIGQVEAGNNDSCILIGINNSTKRDVHVDWVMRILFAKRGP